MLIRFARLVTSLFPSKLCSCHFYTCQYCGNCHNPRCPKRKRCNQM